MINRISKVFILLFLFVVLFTGNVFAEESEGTLNFYSNSEEEITGDFQIGNNAESSSFENGVKFKASSQKTDTIDMTFELKNKEIFIQLDNASNTPIIVGYDAETGDTINLTENDSALLEKLVKALVKKRFGENELEEKLLRSANLLSSWPTSLSVLIMATSSECGSVPDSLPCITVNTGCDLKYPDGVINSMCAYRDKQREVKYPEKGDDSKCNKIKKVDVDELEEKLNINIPYGTWNTLVKPLLNDIAEPYDYRSKEVTVGGDDCVGRCGAGCIGGIDIFDNYSNIYTEDCLNHDVCVDENTNSTAEQCNYLFLKTVDDFVYGPDCSNEFDDDYGIIEPKGAVDMLYIESTYKPTYKWYSVYHKAWGYEFVIKDSISSDKEFKKVYTYDEAGCDKGICKVTPDYPLTAGKWYWWIRPVYNNDGPAFVNASFVVPLVTSSVSANLVSPTGSIETINPTYKWTTTAEQNNLLYLFVITDNKGKWLSNKWYLANQICSGGTCTITPAYTLQKDKDLVWWLIAFDIAGEITSDDITNYINKYISSVKSNIYNAKGWQSLTFTVTTSTDTAPYFESVALNGTVQIPEKIKFSGTAKDDIGLKSISMKVSGPKVTDYTAFTDTESVDGTSKDLSDYYFYSNDSSYAGIAGTYTVKLIITDTLDHQTESKTFTVIVSAATSTPTPTTSTDTAPYFESVALNGTVQIPEKIKFSGTAKDDIGLKSISMKVSGPKVTDYTAFTDTESVDGTSKDLSDYYFYSNDSSYAGIAGTYTVKLIITDTSDQTESKTFTVIVSSATSTPTTEPVSLSTSSVAKGDIIQFSWSGFSGNVNLAVYKGADFWLHANTNVSGSGSQDLDTTDWEVRSDYRVKVELRTDPSVNSWSDYITVTNARAGTVSLSASSVTKGEIVKLTWSGFSGRVNLKVYKGSTFWDYASTNVPGTSSQDLDTTTWEVRSDYRINVESRADTSVNVWSDYLAVNGSATPVPTASTSGTVNLPETGQETCYSSSGSVTSCSGTGHDGELQAGVEWPSPRFTDNGDKTVTDNLTGLMWAKDASTPTVSSCSGGYKTWSNALSYISCLNSISYLGYNDWKLPNINELESLVDADEYGPALPDGHPFSGVQSWYWSSTTYAYHTSYAWYVYMHNGYVYDGNKSSYYHVWPVRLGQ